jgi:hypothetical protein
MALPATMSTPTISANISSGKLHAEHHSIPTGPSQGLKFGLLTSTTFQSLWPVSPSLDWVGIAGICPGPAILLAGRWSSFGPYVTTFIGSLPWPMVQVQAVSKTILRNTYVTFETTQ